MFNKKIGLVALCVALSVSEIWAGTFTNYAIGDVMLGFRKTGGTYDLVVNAGPIATFTNLPVNTRYAISNYTGAQLAQVGTNLIRWSAFTYLDNSLPTAAVPVAAQWTLFATKARATLSTRTTAWTSAGQSLQELTGGQMALIPAGANDMRTFNGLSTPTAVIEQDGSQGNPNYPTGYSYSDAVQDLQDATLADFGGNFGGNVECTNNASFILQSTVVRADFYQIPPTGGGSVKFLGYFEFSTNGTMTYVAYPTAPVVQTVAASAVTGSTAQLNSNVNPTNSVTTLYFQYGLTPSYGSTSLTSNIGTNAGSYGLSVSNLTAAATYHFRAVAYNQYGTNFGSDLSFLTTGSSTPVVPVITGLSHTNNIFAISFSTGNSGTYILRGTNSAGLSAARITWPAISSVTGNGSVITLTATNTNPNQFFLITAQ